jgi:ribosomal-protein-serine acetyltransferase
MSLHLITDENAADVRAMFRGYPDSAYMLSELENSYLPEYDAQGHLRIYGFYSLLDGVLAGMSLLGISSWDDLRGFTGADTLSHMRGKAVAPSSKPPLFYLGFHLLGLNRIETGCLVSNLASKRSIEKTPGFVLEGTLREYGRNTDGAFEDEYRYAILKRDWLKLYQPDDVEVIP